MRRDELIRILREDYLDDVSDAPDQDDEHYRWSGAFLGRALAQAELEACRRVDFIFDDSTAAVCQITLADGTESYALNGKITRIERVFYDGTELGHRTEADMAGIYGDDWRTDTGEPSIYLVKGRRIRPYPIPSADEDGEVLALEVYRLPLAPFQTEPEIPEEYHERLCPYGAHLAYKRRDEDTYDPKKAEEMLAEFNAEFGRPVDPEVREHQLRNPDTLQFTLDTTGYSDN